MSPKTLIILRHGKAEHGAATQDDATRTLTPEGISDAGRIGRELQAQRLRPDAILSSSSMRTRQTVQAMQSEYPHKVPVTFSDKLYLASAGELLKIIADTPESIGTLLLVGHNPGLHQLCLRLAQEGHAALLDQLAVDFPTCALAVITFGATSWAAASNASGTLAQFIMPQNVQA